MCVIEFIWDPSNFECECDKLCDVGHYLDYENCKCKKRLVDKLVEECHENIDNDKLINLTLNNYKNVCGSCTTCIVLLVIFFIIGISISRAIIYFCWNVKKDNTSITNNNANTKTVTY